MTPLNQLLVNFLFVCAHLIAILLWHFVFEILFACGVGGRTCLMIQAVPYYTCQAVTGNLFRKRSTNNMDFFFFFFSHHCHG